MSGSSLCIPRNEAARPRYLQKQNYNIMYPNFHIHLSVSHLYIPKIGLPFLLLLNRQTDPGNILIANRYMNVGIGNEGSTFHFYNT
jgi:hypothetical protein